MEHSLKTWQEVREMWEKAHSTAAALTCGGTEAQHPELDQILEPNFNVADALGIHARGNRAYQRVVYQQSAHCQMGRLGQSQQVVGFLMDPTEMDAQVPTLPIMEMFSSGPERQEVQTIFSSVLCWLWVLLLLAAQTVAHNEMHEWIYAYAISPKSNVGFALWKAAMRPRSSACALRNTDDERFMSCALCSPRVSYMYFWEEKGKIAQGAGIPRSAGPLVGATTRESTSGTTFQGGPGEVKHEEQESYTVEGLDVVLFKKTSALRKLLYACSPIANVLPLLCSPQDGKMQCIYQMRSPTHKEDRKVLEPSKVEAAY
eukprot:1159709-Pelagomonas_calceolata.AAC.1